MSVNPTAERRLKRVRGRARASSERPLPARVQAYLNGQPTAVPSPGDAAEAPEGAERRRSGRVSLDANILVRRLGAFNFEVGLEDMSTGGCRVRLLEPSEVGDPVIARFPQLEPLGSRVCWTRGTTTGVQFLTTIHPAVFESLLTRLPTAK